MKIIDKYKMAFESNDLQSNIRDYFFQHNREDVYAHTEDVVVEALKIANQFGLDRESCIKTALMHDLGRVVSNQDMNSLCEAYGHIFEDGEKENPSILHQVASRILAREVFAETDEAILDAISIHTTLRTNPTPLEMALFMADKLSWKETEMQDQVDTMRAKLVESLECPIAYYFELMNSKKETLICYHRNSQEAYKFFCRNNCDNTKLKNIITERLILIPVTIEITKSLINGSSDEIRKLGIEAAANWPTNDTKDILPIVNRALEKNPEPSGFEFWMVVKKDNQSIIGDIGFHGKPNTDGEVEVGFGFVENERGKGYGYESLNGIMEWLKTQDRVQMIKADCLISNKASIRVLEKAGLKEVYRNVEYIFWKKLNSI